MAFLAIARQLLPPEASSCQHTGCDTSKALRAQVPARCACVCSERHTRVISRNPPFVVPPMVVLVWYLGCEWRRQTTRSCENCFRRPRRASGRAVCSTCASEHIQRCIGPRRRRRMSWRRSAAPLPAAACIARPVSAKSPQANALSRSHQLEWKAHWRAEHAHCVPERLDVRC